MEFDSNKPIYLQIIDNICDRILSGELNAEDRILSVRELGAEVGVNPNTVARSYEKMTDAGIIYTKRGLGYFVAPGAKDAVLSTARKEFMENDVPQFLRKMELLGIKKEEIF